MSDFITVRIPREHWEQIVSDIENMCGDSKENIEILADAWVVEEPDAYSLARDRGDFE